MLSLAPIMYRRVLGKNGGPIERLFITEAEISLGVFGYEASCYLKENLRNSIPVTSILYGSPDGTGSDRFKSQACYKAVSEALERWAYYETSQGKLAKRFGFDIDPSTNGMAAFPSCLRRNSKSVARFEALERWALVEWWIGNLTAERGRINDADCISLQVPRLGSVVILWKQIPDLTGIYAYGFAGSSDSVSASQKAQIELLRNIYVIKKYHQNQNPAPPSDMHIQEQRVLWFSKLEGHEQFLSRVTKSDSHPKINHTPQLIIDAEIVGPWTEYAKVWRCLFESTIPFSEHHSRLEFFLF